MSTRSRSLRPLLSSFTRETVFKRDGSRCRYCGKQVSRSVAHKHHARGVIDHMTPLSRGGSNEPDNLCVACNQCDQRKGSMTAEEFEELLESERDATDPPF